MATKQEIINDIEAYRQSRVLSRQRSEWYVGIAEDAKQRLFNDHAVPERETPWIHRKADSETVAREAEKALHDLGYDGGPGGGSSKTLYVYAYLKTSKTVE